MGSRYASGVPAEARSLDLSAELHPTCQRYVDFLIVRGLANGSLDPDVFKNYVAQDAFFLRAFFSAYALGAARAVERSDVVQRLHRLMSGVLDELKLHEAYAKSLAIGLGCV